MNLIVHYTLAMLIRAWILSSQDLSAWLESRVELSTPINSFKRLTEGTTLLRQGVDPYSGVLFHETPLLLHAFRWMEDHLSHRRITAIFILVDAITAVILGKLGKVIAKHLMDVQTRNSQSYHKDSTELLMKAANVAKIERYVQLAFLFHPYIITNCAAKTTTGFSNLLLALFLLSTMKQRPMVASFFLAFLTYESIYTVMLIFPLCAVLLLKENLSWHTVTKAAFPVVGVFTAFFVLINFISFKLLGDSWNFLFSTHGFCLSVPELTPNMGLFWYFFTEMFEHFRIFFVCTFQINCFVYVLPLTIKFHKDPYLLAFTLIGLTAIFKSYPCYGEVGFYTALLPTVAFHLVPYMKQTFIIANMFLATTMLAPILYQLWIFNGSANANYFFAITLVFGTAQIFLLTDILFAHVKREFYLLHGYKALMAGKPSSKSEGCNGSESSSKLILR